MVADYQYLTSAHDIEQFLIHSSRSTAVSDTEASYLSSTQDILGAPIGLVVLDLARYCVNQEIDDLLEDYPRHPYRTAFSLVALREQLVNEVLSYITMHKLSANYSAESWEMQHCLLPSGAYLNGLIHIGIANILRRNLDWLKQQSV